MPLSIRRIDGCQAGREFGLLAALSLVVAIEAGCVSRRAPDIPQLIFPPLNFSVRFPQIRLKGPPPREFQFPKLKPAEIDMINLDGFFPADSSRVLVAEDAYQAGLFRRIYVPGSTGESTTSPDGMWRLERRPILQNGVVSDVIELVNTQTRERRNFWGIERFAGCIWSPDSRALALNDLRKSEISRVNIASVESSDLVEVAPPASTLADFLPPTDLQVETLTYEARRWASESLIIVWVHGKKTRYDSRPLWGFEALIETRDGETGMCRILRAFVR